MSNNDGGTGCEFGWVAPLGGRLSLVSKERTVLIVDDHDLHDDTKQQAIFFRLNGSQNSTKTLTVVSLPYL